MKAGFRDDTLFTDTCSLEPNWWVFALRGVLALIFGVVGLWMPGAAVLAMTLVFGAYAFVDGIFYLVSGIRHARRGQQWGGLVFAGAIGIATGVVVAVVPLIAVISLTAFLWTMIAFWSISTGVLEISAAARLRQEIKGEWLLGFSGALSVLLGMAVIFLFMFNPLVSVLSLGILMGIYALASGGTLLWLAFKLRNREHLPSRMAHA